jgi:hypothetical protein
VAKSKACTVLRRLNWRGLTAWAVALRLNVVGMVSPRPPRTAGRSATWGEGYELPDRELVVSLRRPLALLVGCVLVAVLAEIGGEQAVDERACEGLSCGGMAAVKGIQGRQSEGRKRCDSFRVEPLNRLPTVCGGGLPAAPEDLAALGSAIGADECLRNGDRGTP